MAYHNNIHWTFLFLLVWEANAAYYYPAARVLICGRPVVNSTVPDTVHAKIHSPGYPSGYLGPHDCTITINVPELSWIGFFTEDFYIKRSGSLCGDSLTFRSQERPEKGSAFCGNLSSEQLLFHESTFYEVKKIDVHFQAQPFPHQEEIPEQKFAVEYTVADLVYPGVNSNHSKDLIVNGYGYIVSHPTFGSSGDVYDKNIDSHLTLTGLQPNMVLEIYLIHAELHRSLNCSDRLTVSGISLAPYTVEPLVVCGSVANNTAFDILVIGTSINFHFKTDGGAGGSGFRIQYFVKGRLTQDDLSTYTPGAGMGGFEAPTTISSTKDGRRSDQTNETITTTEVNEDQKTTYIYLGLGIGGGNLLIAIIIVTIVCAIVKRKRRRREIKTESVRTGPLPSTNGGPYDTRSKVSGASPTEMYDDESAYYSEIGSFQKHKEKEEQNVHYASRPIYDANFYHALEEPTGPPPIPSSPPVEPKAAPPMMTFTSKPPTGPLVRPPLGVTSPHRSTELQQQRDRIHPHTAHFSNNNERSKVETVRIEYQPRTWKTNQGVQRF